MDRTILTRRSVGCLDSSGCIRISKSSSRSRIGSPSSPATAQGSAGHWRRRLPGLGPRRDRTGHHCSRGTMRLGTSRPGRARGSTERCGTVGGCLRRTRHLGERRRGQPQTAAPVPDGHSNRQIARRLTTGEQTVKTHVSAILTKLNLQDRVQAAIFALRHQVAAPPSSNPDRPSRGSIPLRTRPPTESRSVSLGGWPAAALWLRPRAEAAHLAAPPSDIKDLLADPS